MGLVARWKCTPTLPPLRLAGIAPVRPTPSVLLLIGIALDGRSIRRWTPLGRRTRLAKTEKHSQPEAANTEKQSGLLKSAAEAVGTVPDQLRISTQIAMQTQSGPIPSPEILKKYNEIEPGLAQRIIAMAEAEAEHRRSIEAQVVAIQGRDQSAYRRSEFFGQVFGLLIGLAYAIGAVYAAVHGAQMAASIFGTAGVGGLVTAFIMGRHNLYKMKQQELEQDQKITRRDTQP